MGLQDFLYNEQIRPLTDNVIARAPDTVDYKIDVKYFINRSDVGKASTIQAEVNEAINEFVSWQRSKIGRDINPSRLVQMMVAAGAKRVEVTYPVYQSIQNKVINADNTLVLKVAITNKGSDFELQAGYDITEFGIFAQDPQKGEILYSIATASTSDYMPAYNGVIPSVINMSYYLEVANAANVTINSAGAIALQADLEALEERVSVIEQNKVELLGVRKKVGASSSAWERIGDAIGMVCKAAVGNGTVQNDMMSHFPFNEMKPCNLAADRTVNAYLGDADFQWDGSNGDVMMEVPMTYTGRWFETDADGVKWEYRAVSSGKIGHLHLDHRRCRMRSLRRRSGSNHHEPRSVDMLPEDRSDYRHGITERTCRRSGRKNCNPLPLDRGLVRKWLAVPRWRQYQ